MSSSARGIILLLAISAFCFVTTCLAQTVVELPRTVIEADSLQTTGKIITACGNVVVRSGVFKISASEIWFDAELQRGRLTDATFTTCEKERPDYQLSTRELALISNRRIRARGVALYVGRWRLIGLPSITFTVGRGASSDVFPRPSYDEREGYGIAQRFALVDTSRWQVVTDLRFTTKRGLLAEGESVWGIDGELDPLPERLLTHDSMKFTPLSIPKSFTRRGEVSDPSGGYWAAAKCRLFARFATDQRAFDLRERRLSVSRQPEIGFLYVGRPLVRRDVRADPDLELYPSLKVFWGQYKENPGSTMLTRRVGFETTAAINVLPLPSNLAIQPLLGYSKCFYEGGDVYSTVLCGIDAAKAFRDGSLISVRYLHRSESGKSPFLFDSVQVRHDLQGALQTRLGSQIVGFAVGYDADKRELYDWQALVGYRTDCLGVWASWDNFQRRLTIGVALINL